MHDTVTRKTAKSITVTPKTTTFDTVTVKTVKSNTLRLKLSAAPHTGDKGCTGPARYEFKGCQEAVPTHREPFWSNVGLIFTLAS